MPRNLSLSETLKWVPEARRRGVSAVATGDAPSSDGGFISAYKRAKTLSNLPPYWKQKRQGFIARHMAQYENERSSRRGDAPTRRELALIIWAYDPR